MIVYHCIIVYRVRLSVRHSAKMAEQIQVNFRSPRNIVLDYGPDPSTARGRGRRFNAAIAKLLWPLVITSKVTRCTVYRI